MAAQSAVKARFQCRSVEESRLLDYSGCEYVNDTLTGTGLVVRRDPVTLPDALTTAKTATGGEFHSDGRILVLVLKSSASAAN
jgi:hypothetical protein